MIDHLIISESGFTSFREKGIMQQLKESGLYKVVSLESEQMKELQLKFEKEKAVKEELMKTARRLKEMGMDFIKKATGLYVRDIKQA